MLQGPNSIRELSIEHCDWIIYDLTNALYHKLKNGLETLFRTDKLSNVLYTFNYANS